MPRFYSAEWVEAFNRAVSDLDPDGDGADEDGARRQRFRVAQVVRATPPELDPDGTGELTVVLEAADGRLTMRRLGPGEHEEGAEVTVLLDYADAAALSSGALDPPAALSAGRIRVRGDLSVLVAGQALLAAARPRLAGLQAETTY